MEDPVASTSTAPVAPREPAYCQVCSLPPEYCEFGSRLSKCKARLREVDPALFGQLYPDADRLASHLASLTVEERTKLEKDQEKLEKEAAKKERKEEAKDEKREKKRQESQVTIKKIDRSKRKRITAVHGLEAFDVDLKKLAKLFAGKFACGASVTKNNQGEDEIVIQGDVADDILDLFEETSGKFAEMIGNGKIPDDNIVVVEDKKKKGAGS